MQLDQQSTGGAVVLAAAGRIDHESAKAFQAALEPHLDKLAPDSAPIVFDMSGVDYVSSVGLRVLLMASKRASAQNGKIAVAAMQPSVADVFRISHFHRILPVFETVDAAVADLNS